ncbi:type IV pilus modification protein PilV [Pseudomonadota bacterium]
MITLHSKSLAARSHGFTLIEVMIAVLVLSLGLLGLAGLQATSLKANASAATRGQATLLAYDIIDRMRANRDAALAGTYNNTAGTAPTSGGSNCQANGATCDGNAIAAYDLNQWKCLLGKWKTNSVCSTTLGINKGLLPDGDGSVVVNNGNEALVTITWTETRWEDGERVANQIPLAIRTGL